MDMRRAQSATVAIQSSNLPSLRPWDMKALTRPGRREATARVRQEWEQGKHRDQPRGDEMARLKEYAAYVQKLRKYKEKRFDVRQRRANLQKSVFTDMWEKEVLKRNTPERLPYVTHVRAVTAPPRPILQDTARTAVPVFQQVSGKLRHAREANRKPVHFIDKEWSSERVSWVRFHSNLSDYHTRSWIE